MDIITLVLSVLSAVLCVALILTWLEKRKLGAKLQETETELDEVNEARIHAQAQVKAFESSKQDMENAFAKTSATVLEQASTSFLRQAEEKFKSQDEKSNQSLAALVNPMRETLAKFDTYTRAIEAERNKAYGSLEEHLKALKGGLDATQTTTTQLTEALRGSSQTRGRWGEETLKNVLDQVGMTQHISYDQQAHLEGEAGRQRPDVIVKLPGGGAFVIDAKAPLSGYFDALEATDEDQKKAALKRHALNMRTHMKSLSARKYTDALDFTPDIVAMFVPGDHFLSAAYEVDPNLFEDSFDQRVMLVTPTTLYGLLKSVSYGWRLEDQAKNARDVADLGRELYKRLSTMSGHVEGMGKNLGAAIDRYNKFVGSLERQVLPQARRFEDLGVDHTGKDIPDLKSIETQASVVSSKELT